jgi:hypothetical protein
MLSNFHLFLLLVLLLFLLHLFLLSSINRPISLSFYCGSSTSVHHFWQLSTPFPSRSLFENSVSWSGLSYLFYILIIMSLIYLIIYITKLYILQGCIPSNYMMITNDTVRGSGRKQQWPILRYYLNVYLGRPKKTTENLNQDSGPSGENRTSKD